ncbi:helix-turn-helix domain-containing protein [Ferruginibacter yonginensis]|uniref:Helix-turn-helix domain-containing protein n=1 Tax=Ferruginibacter yonginensis TaxID=1310416 RepID=A0ABV8QNP6_9BACT
MTTGNIILNAIRGKGFTIDEAAEKLGISRSKVYYQTSKSIPDKEFIDLLLEKMGIEIVPNDLEQNVSKRFVVGENKSSYNTAKDEIIASLKQTIEAKDSIIEMQRNRIAELEAQVNATAVRNSA